MIVEISESSESKILVRMEIVRRKISLFINVKFAFILNWLTNLFKPNLLTYNTRHKLGLSDWISPSGLGI